jgi:hypothetical protein
MAYELVEEVLDHAPAMSPAERLALVVIAEAARKGSRTAAIPQEVLIQRMGGLGERGLRKVFERLEDLGIKVRVPLGMNNNGRPFYALPGKACTFVLPPFPAPENCPCHRCKAKEPQFPKENPKELWFPVEEPQFLSGGTTVPRRGTTVPPIPSGDPYGVSPDHTNPLPPATRFGAGTLSAKDAQESIRSALEKSTMRTKPLNGRRPHGSFGALMAYPVDSETGDPPDAQTPGL